MKVLALTRYAGLGVTSRIRFLQYIPYLTEAGFDVTVGHFLSDEYVSQLHKAGRGTRSSVLDAYWRRMVQLMSARKHDVVWLEKEVLPWLPALAERLIRAAGIPLVVDYDDATFHGYDMHSSVIVRTLLGKKIDRVMSKASIVVAGNDYLAERARKAGASRVEYLPTVVDLDHYPLEKRTPQPTFTIGWIGSAWTARYLPMLEGALRQVCENGSARVLLIGSGPVSLKGVPVELKSWSESDEYHQIRRCDVGIMPLPDSPFERGKCGYKLIQYMACGLPVVASPVGVNQQIVEHGKSGFLASTETEWISALTQLRDDASLRQSMGQLGRAKVEQSYSLEAHAPRLASILLSLL